MWYSNGMDDTGQHYHHVTAVHVRLCLLCCDAALCLAEPDYSTALF